MSWLDRLKSHQVAEGHATEPTKPGSVGFVALDRDASPNSLPPIVPPRLRAASPANADVLQCAVDRTCANCPNLLRHGTCGEPVRAGLVPSFEIVWPPDGHGAGCAAFTGTLPAKVAVIMVSGKVSPCESVTNDEAAMNVHQLHQGTDDASHND